MKTFARALFPVLTAVCVLTLSACGSASSGSASDQSAETTTAALETATPDQSAPPETPPGTAGGPPEVENVDGVWKVAAGSEAGYRVPEVLNGQKTEGVGRTSGVTGTMTLAGTSATAAEFVFDMTKLLSDSGKRDSQVQTRIMRTAEFPTATFTLTGPVDFGAIPANKEEVTAKATGDLTIHGVTKSVTIDLSARLNGPSVEVLGSHEIKFADYSIEDPSFKPFVEVGETGFIEWLLVMSK